MNNLRIMLLTSTIAIYTLTVIAIMAQGWNWPAAANNDLLALDWRTQFDFDFLIHLLLLATWVVWREGATGKAYLFGFLSVIMGGMFRPTSRIAFGCACAEANLTNCSFGPRCAWPHN